MRQWIMGYFGMNIVQWNKAILPKYHQHQIVKMGQIEKTVRLSWFVFFFSIQTAHHVTYTFQSESTLCSCLNVKELIARNRRDIWSLSDCNGTRTHNHLVRKQTLNLLAKLARLVNGWVFVYELSGCGFEFRWSHKMSILRSSKHLHDFEW